ncbi:MAG: hypothetical protein J6Y95_00500 [Lachnospiraceae bacterium]|nr:hypothetical protein [Lachnospiraceae bacterium]
MAKPDPHNDRIKKLIPYLLVILFAGLAVLLVALLTKPREEKPEDVSTEPVMTTEEPTEETLPTAAAIDVGRIEILMEEYYKAKTENDVDTLNRIIESDTVYTLADLTGESQYIDRYENFRNYVMPGVSEEYFVVYVTYDLFFRGIDTGAPSLNRFIIAKDTGGNYFIYDRKVTQEFADYLAKLDASPTITGLRKQVEDGLQRACEKDIDLNELIRLLNTGETKAPSSEAPQGETQPSQALRGRDI